MKKEKKTPGDIILYMCNITGCTVPEIWSTTDRIFFILDSFLPFYPTNPKNQNFQKMRKTTRDIIILHKSTKNHDHMPHHSWDATRDGCNFYFSFCASFCPLPPCTHSRWSSCENSEKQVLKKKNSNNFAARSCPTLNQSQGTEFSSKLALSLIFTCPESDQSSGSTNELLTEGWNIRHDFIKPCYYFVKPWIQLMLIHKDQERLVFFCAFWNPSTYTCFLFQ